MKNKIYLIVAIILFFVISLPPAVSNSFFIFERTNTVSVKGLEITEVSSPKMCVVDKIEIQCSYLLYLKQKIDDELQRKKYRDENYSSYI